MTKPTKWHERPAKTQADAQTDLSLRAQADLSLRWAQGSFCWFSHEVA